MTLFVRVSSLKYTFSFSSRGPLVPVGFAATITTRDVSLLTRDAPTSERCSYVSPIAFRLQRYTLSFGSAQADAMRQVE